MNRCFNLRKNWWEHSARWNSTIFPQAKSNGSSAFHLQGKPVKIFRQIWNSRNRVITHQFTVAVNWSRSMAPVWLRKWYSDIPVISVKPRKKEYLWRSSFFPEQFQVKYKRTVPFDFPPEQQVFSHKRNALTERSMNRFTGIYIPHRR